MLETPLTCAISELFGLPPDQVRPETGRDTIADWDSIGHLKLILSVEKAYGVRFPTAELPELTSARRIQDALDRLRSIR